MSTQLRRPADIVDLIERAILAVLSSAMVTLALLQILLRGGFGTGWPWIEPVLGVLLLWTALAGALAATGQRRHIAMDLCSHLLPPRAASVLRVPVNVLASVICIGLTVASIGFIRLQRETETGQLFGMPIWWASAALPFVFAIMALRFLVHAVDAALEAARGSARPPEGSAR